MHRLVFPVLAFLVLTGHGPFQCQSAEVDRAADALKAGEPKTALDALAELTDDAPEVHLVRGLAHLMRDELDEANGALDQAYRLVAGAEARGEPLPNGKALRQRVAFLRGLVTAKRENWADALVEFRKALELDPSDEDARWNLEMAWYKANPPCPAREDDHEPDDTRKDAKPWEEKHGKDRLLCPGNTDWFTLSDVPQNGMLYVRLNGEIDTSDEETREVVLALYGPGDADNAPTQQAPMKGGKAAVAVGGVRRGGVWHVRVEGPGRAEVKYGVEVEIVPPCPVDDKLEENDSMEAAKEVKEPQKGLKACPGDPDWYRVEVPKTEAMQASVAYDAKRAPLRAALYDQYGTLVMEGRESAGGIGLGIPQLEEKPEPKDDKGKGAKGADPAPEPPPETQTWYIEVAAATDEENNYALQVQPPSDGGKDNQDQNKDQQDDKKDENKDQGDQDKKEDQKKQDQGDDQNDQQKKDQKQPQPKEQEQKVDLDKLIDALDKHPKNPQLEKALRGLQVVPRMEDY